MGIVDYILKKDMNTAKLANYFDSLIKQDALLEQIQKESIAVLDDSKFGLNVIKNIFELHKIKNVSYYTDPQKFLDESGKHAIFLVDLVLPEISGEEVIIELIASIIENKQNQKQEENCDQTKNFMPRFIKALDISHSTIL